MTFLTITTSVTTSAKCTAGQNVQVFDENKAIVYDVCAALAKVPSLTAHNIAFSGSIVYVSVINKPGTSDLTATMTVNPT